jgi:hypothetical protein
MAAPPVPGGGGLRSDGFEYSRGEPVSPPPASHAAAISVRHGLWQRHHTFGVIVPLLHHWRCWKCCRRQRPRRNRPTGGKAGLARMVGMYHAPHRPHRRRSPPRQPGMAISIGLQQLVCLPKHHAPPFCSILAKTRHRPCLILNSRGETNTAVTTVPLLTNHTVHGSSTETAACRNWRWLARYCQSSGGCVIRLLRRKPGGRCRRNRLQGGRGVGVRWRQKLLIPVSAGVRRQPC